MFEKVVSFHEGWYGSEPQVELLPVDMSDPNGSSNPADEAGRDRPCGRTD